jgi:uncharacterized protein (TIGR04255 family)
MFALNWRKVGTAPYPRYATLRERFERELQSFQDFLASENMVIGLFTRYQLVYVNHVDWGPPNARPLEVSDLVGSWDESRLAFADNLRSINMSTTYELADGVELTMQLQRAIRVPDGQEVLQLTLQTSSLPVEPFGGNLMERFDRLHADLIDAFQRTTSKRAKELWGKE